MGGPRRAGEGRRSAEGPGKPAQRLHAWVRQSAAQPARPGHLELPACTGLEIFSIEKLKKQSEEKENL